MLSIRCNSRVRSLRNQSRFAKNYKIKPFINWYSWEGINFRSEKNDWKIFEKNNVTIALYILYAKKENIHPAYVSKLWKASYSFNAFKWRMMALSCSKKTINIINRNTVWTAFILLQQKTNLNLIRKYVKIKIFVML